MLSIIPVWSRCGYLDVPAELCGEALVFHVFNSSFTSEQVNGHTRRKETLMLLPFKSLKEEKKKWSEVMINILFGKQLNLHVC